MPYITSEAFQRYHFSTHLSSAPNIWVDTLLNQGFVWGWFKEEELRQYELSHELSKCFFRRQQLPEFPLKCDKSLAVKNICLQKWSMFWSIQVLHPQDLSPSASLSSPRFSGEQQLHSRQIPPSTACGGKFHTCFVWKSANLPDLPCKRSDCVAGSDRVLQLPMECSTFWKSTVLFVGICRNSLWKCWKFQTELDNGRVCYPKLDFRHETPCIHRADRAPTSPFLSSRRRVASIGSTFCTLAQRPPYPRCTLLSSGPPTLLLSWPVVKIPSGKLT